jgi:hypothetical protein
MLVKRTMLPRSILSDIMEIKHLCMNSSEPEELANRNEMHVKT